MFLFGEPFPSTGDPKSHDEPGKGEARGEEPAVAPAGEAQRLRCAKAAPGRKVVVEEASIVDAKRPLTGRRTQDVPQRKECSSLARVAGTPGPYRPSRVTRRYRC